MSEIKKIVLSVGDKEIELTPDEAKELRKILGDLFGEKETTVVPMPYPVYPNYPYFGGTWVTTWSEGTGLSPISKLNVSTTEV